MALPPTLAELLQSDQAAEHVVAQGWVRTRRDSKSCSFIELTDGSLARGLQVVVESDCKDAGLMPQILTGASLRVEGSLIASPAAGQRWELKAASLEILGACDAGYPLQKKGHSPEFLRSIAHLRPRTQFFGNLLRVRSRLANAVHEFFQARRFHWVHTPIITSSDCEGAGEMFRLTTQKNGEALSNKGDFFGRAAYLTVSGQLQGEAMTCGIGRIYAFGPTFRAENSNTTRHAAEFWMIEPEMAFADLQTDMSLAEEHVRHMTAHMLEHCEAELEFFNRFVDGTLRARLEQTLARPFERMSYTQAVELLQASGRNFTHPVIWGEALQTEHERYLAEEHVKGPVTLHDYPQGIKPFYMRRNEDGRTVAAMDLLVPGIGEIIGGSQREERLDLLLQAMQQQGLSAEDYDWYVDLRRYGSVPHAGYGMGFERLLMFATGISNIRDVIAFARTPGQAFT